VYAAFDFDEEELHEIENHPFANDDETNSSNGETNDDNTAAFNLAPSNSQVSLFSTVLFFIYILLDCFYICGSSRQATSPSGHWVDSQPEITSPIHAIYFVEFNSTFGPPNSFAYSWVDFDGLATASVIRHAPRQSGEQGELAAGKMHMVCHYLWNLTIYEPEYTHYYCPIQELWMTMVQTLMMTTQMLSPM
jgi:hypothetical protein